MCRSPRDGPGESYSPASGLAAAAEPWVSDPSTASRPQAVTASALSATTLSSTRLTSSPVVLTPTFPTTAVPANSAIRELTSSSSPEFTRPNSPLILGLSVTPNACPFAEQISSWPS